MQEMQEMKDLYNRANHNLNTAIEAFETDKSGTDAMLAARENFQDIIRIVDAANDKNNLMVHSSFMYNKGRCLGLIKKINKCQDIVAGKDVGGIPRVIRILSGDEELF